MWGWEQNVGYFIYFWVGRHLEFGGGGWLISWDGCHQSLVGLRPYCSHRFLEFGRDRLLLSEVDASKVIHVIVVGFRSWWIIKTYQILNRFWKSMTCFTPQFGVWLQQCQERVAIGYWLVSTSGTPIGNKAAN